ncbi:MAG TPA: hypothetical protein PL033_12555, partial [Candidatus Brocadiia bacterium]|nr:hypothetical protein [Candidatus Brocadiia bacterium]
MARAGERRSAKNSMMSPELGGYSFGLGKADVQVIGRWEIAKGKLKFSGSLVREDKYDWDSNATYPITNTISIPGPWLKRVEEEGRAKPYDVFGAAYVKDSFDKPNSPLKKLPFTLLSSADDLQ